ncbi:growth arrest and DNA damage-inducible protein GADD45 beta [Arapaima gigas]
MLRTEKLGEAVEKLLVAAQRQGCLTLGVYEAAELMNLDPDCAVLCLLATDEEDEDDIALQIHFTLLQAFCWDNYIHLLRVSGLGRLAQVLGEPSTSSSNANEPRDLHCILVTEPPADSEKWPGLTEVSSYCQEGRRRNQWAPFLALRER